MGKSLLGELKGIDYIHLHTYIQLKSSTFRSSFLVS